MSLKSNEQRGVYIHIPFCRRKCPYCHFAITPYQAKKVPPYLEALAREYRIQQNDVSPYTLYFGGGTPSTLTPDELHILMQLFDTSTTKEITLEVNPEDVSPEYIQAIRQLGINRISMGVQSLDNHQLQVIERRHNAQQVLDALNAIYTNGISNISIDLMYDLPYQTLSSFQRTLNALADLPITHISLYNLVLEQGSLYAKQEAKIRPQMPKDTASRRMLDLAVEKFAQQG